jgi:hypothetical protein
MSWNTNEPTESWGRTETPLEVQQRIRAQQDHEQRQREARAAAEQERLARPLPPLAKTLGEINDPVERQNFLAQQRADEQQREAESTARLMKERVYRAFIQAGGVESEFESQYPVLRERMIQDETVRRLQGQARAGEYNADGTVR